MSHTDDVLLEMLRRAVARKPMRPEPDPDEEEERQPTRAGAPIALNDDAALARIIGGALNNF